MSTNDLAAIAAAMQPLKAVRDAMANSGFSAIQRELDRQRPMQAALKAVEGSGFRGIQRELDRQKLKGSTFANIEFVRQIIPKYRWPEIGAGLREYQQIGAALAQQTAQVNATMEAIRNAVLPAHYAARAFQNRFAELQQPPRAIREIIAAAARYRLPDEFVADLASVDEQLEVIELALQATSAGSAPVTGWPASQKLLSPADWLNLFLAVLGLLGTVWGLIDSAETERRILDAIEQGKASGDARLLKIESLLHQVLIAAATVQEPIYVVNHQARVRSRKGGGLDVAVAYPNQRVTCVAHDGKWFKVRYHDYVDDRDVEGWVRKKHLHRDESEGSDGKLDDCGSATSLQSK